MISFKITKVWTSLLLGSSFVLMNFSPIRASQEQNNQALNQTLPLQSNQEVVSQVSSDLNLPLSPGDRVRISISEPRFGVGQFQQQPNYFQLSGLYEVNLDNTVNLPLLEPISVQNMSLSTFESVLRNELVEAGLFQPSFLQVSAEISQWAPVQVLVSGAVFSPGRILADGNLSQDILRTRGVIPPARADAPFTLSGSYPTERFATSVLKQAGGVKPNADLENIRLIRNGSERTLNLLGVLTGEPVTDVALVAGDQLIIPQLSTEQSVLIRPSSITPDVIGVFVANQTEPQGGGRTGGQLTEFAYGTRFSQGAIAALCGGGTRTTNANRRITLIRTETENDMVNVYDTNVEQLIRSPNLDSAENPFLMPSDSIVCYDSRVTNISGIFQFLNLILNPVRTVIDIFDRNND